MKKKETGKLIFCSVPERGLENLFKIIPIIKKRFPDISLVITSDYRLWGSVPANERFKEMFSSMANVSFYGKLDREKLLEQQKTSEIMVYPCDYDENFCISAAECMAAGTVPVTTDIGALRTTVKDGGIILKGNPKDVGYQMRFAEEVCNLLEDKVKLNELSEKGKEIAKRYYDWRLIARDWHTLITKHSRNNMVNLMAHLYPFKIEELSVLDLGCGDYTSNISEQTPLLPFKELTGVEVFEKDLTAAKTKDFLSKKLAWHNQDILSFLKENKKTYDVVFLFDVLEHFNKEDGMKVLKEIEKIANKRILMFMPIGEHTLEANDGRVEAEGNHWQKHLSQWELNEWRGLGYDVEHLPGFHHSGILDAAWLIKDFEKGKPYMKKCTDCDQTYKSSYFLQRHRVSHGDSDNNKVETIQVKQNEIEKKMRVKIYLKRRIDISVPNVNGINTNMVDVPYEQFADVSRVITEAYGPIIEKSEMYKI